MRESAMTCRFIDKKKVKRIFPILVIYEHFLNSPFTNYHFNKYFREMIIFSSLSENIELMPLTLITIEDLEASQPFLGEINRIILERINVDPNLYFSYSDFMKNKYRTDPTLKCEWIDVEYDKFAEETKANIFGS
jgi:hypothetical protein